MPEYLSKVKEGRIDWIREVAVLLTCIVGALTLLTDIEAPIALGILSLVRRGVAPVEAVMIYASNEICERYQSLLPANF